MPRRILLTDDDELILISLEELFESEGFAVHTAASGAEALRITGELTLDLVVLDIIMPGMSGLEVCRRLRATEGYEEVPIILLTAKSTEADRVEGLAAGANLFLPKPFDPARLVEMAKETLGES